MITKEHQEALVSNYVKEKHTQEECIGFIDGLDKALSLVNENKKGVLNNFILEVKKEFPNQNWDYLNFIANRV